MTHDPVLSFLKAVSGIELDLKHRARGWNKWSSGQMAASTGVGDPVELSHVISALLSYWLVTLAGLGPHLGRL